MHRRIRSLANLMQEKKRREEGSFVLLLGAGASLASGVKRTPDIMNELLERFGNDIEGRSLEERFDQLWSRTPDAQRRMFLEPYLEERPPSPGYQQLARLITAGYFDLVITFNYDRLLERSLQAEGFTDFRAIVRGDFQDDQIATLLAAKKPQVHLLKMHGSLMAGDTFLFSREEMLNYPPEIKSLLRQLTRRDVIVCGYAFNDICVVRSFSEDGGAIYCVDPGGAPMNLKPFLGKRRSSERVIDGELGKFDNFFEALAAEVFGDRSEAEAKPRLNPFKYLESYRPEDAAWFLGRKDLLRELLAKVEDPDLRAVHVVGNPRVGKTSFVRAGLMAALQGDGQPSPYSIHYVRCRAQLDRCLCDEIGRCLGRRVEGDARSALASLAESTSKRVVVILDQFERVVDFFNQGEGGHQALHALIESLASGGPANLTLVFVGANESNYLLSVARSKAELVLIMPFEERRLGAIVRLLAWLGGIRFEPRVIRDLAALYGSSQTGARPFTLAHVQALCNILGAQAHIDWELYQQALNEHREALDLAITECDILSFVEDFPLEGERILLRNIMRIASHPSKRKIAHYVKNRFEELLMSAPFPEAPAGSAADPEAANGDSPGIAAGG